MSKEGKIVLAILSFLSIGCIGSIFALRSEIKSLQPEVLGAGFRTQRGPLVPLVSSGGGGSGESWVLSNGQNNLAPSSSVQINNFNNTFAVDTAGSIFSSGTLLNMIALNAIVSSTQGRFQHLNVSTTLFVNTIRPGTVTGQTVFDTGSVRLDDLVELYFGDGLSSGSFAIGYETAGTDRGTFAYGTESRNVIHVSGEDILLQTDTVYADPTDCWYSTNAFNNTDQRRFCLAQSNSSSSLYAMGTPLRFESGSSTFSWFASGTEMMQLNGNGLTLNITPNTFDLGRFNVQNNGDISTSGTLAVHSYASSTFEGALVLNASSTHFSGNVLQINVDGLTTDSFTGTGLSIDVDQSQVSSTAWALLIKTKDDTTTSTNLFGVDKFGYVYSDKGFIEYSSVVSEDFNLKRSTVQTTDRIPGSDGSGWGDSGQWLVDMAAGGGSIYSLGVAPGYTTVSSSGGVSSNVSVTFSQSALSMNRLTSVTSSPRFITKVRTGDAGTLRTMTYGLIPDQTSQGARSPVGLYWTNNTSTEWIGVVANTNGTSSTVTCGFGVSSTAWMLFDISVDDNVNARFQMDEDTRDGIQMKQCGTLNATGITEELGIQLSMFTETTNASGTMDIDYVRLFNR